MPGRSLPPGCDTAGALLDCCDGALLSQERSCLSLDFWHIFFPSERADALKRTAIDANVEN